MFFQNVFFSSIVDFFTLRCNSGFKATMPAVNDVVYANMYPAVLTGQRGRKNWKIRYLSAHANSHYHCDESRMKAVHVQDTVTMLETPWGLLEDGLREARRLIEADPSKGGWGSADIKLRAPTQSVTHGTVKLGLRRNGAGLQAQGAPNGLAPVTAGAPNGLAPVAADAPNGVAPVAADAPNGLAPVAAGAPNGLAPVAAGAPNGLAPVAAGPPIPPIVPAQPEERRAKKRATSSVEGSSAIKILKTMEKQEEEEEIKAEQNGAEEAEGNGAEEAEGSGAEEAEGNGAEEAAQEQSIFSKFLGTMKQWWKK
ncbi:hypothetical protein B9Z55_023588 [Caenorhabditis nigoni]|uniref:Uncharacterized protein n=1 Tax=Caenorhabditis nigoni TaxID=1611254 RepID=A0A2G5SQU6_9PELO|nr:hypothetical protein B9Z55_023588 [Caenorhabditis nigoni]